jgi:hypothetical protein
MWPITLKVSHNTLKNPNLKHLIAGYYYINYLKGIKYLILKYSSIALISLFSML